MLKGISPLLSPELLKILAEMGHGDEIVIGDCNFPAVTLGKRCIRADGLKVTDLVDAILELLPLDSFVAEPVTLMKVVSGTFEGEPPIWSEFKKIIDKHEKNIKIQFIERSEFYDKSRQAFATIQSSENALFACIILKKGILIREQ
jgi:L-fucose mutarotase